MQTLSADQIETPADIELEVSVAMNKAYDAAVAAGIDPTDVHAVYEHACSIWPQWSRYMLELRERECIAKQAFKVTA